MLQHLQHAAFGDLHEAGRLARRRDVHVQRIESRARALRRKLRRVSREPVQIADLLLAQQVVHIRPAFDALGRAHAYEAPPRFQHLQTLAVLHRSQRIGSRPQVLAKIYGRRPGVRGSRRRLLFRSRRSARHQQERRGQHARAPASPRAHQPMPSSSTCSSGVPHFRQIIERQSPQISGSFTSCRHWGQYNSVASRVMAGHRRRSRELQERSRRWRRAPAGKYRTGSSRRGTPRRPACGSRVR